MTRSRLALLAGIHLVLANTFANASITAGQIDTFQDGTTDDWGGGDQLDNLMGGPLGSSDRYLRLTSSGGGGTGSKLATNNFLQWAGDYSAAGVTSIGMDLLNTNTSPVATPLAMRIVLFGPSGSRWSSTVADVVPADSQWHHEVFSLLQSDLTEVVPGDTYTATITGVNHVQIRYDEGGPGGTPSTGGTTFAGMLGIDNITAVAPALGIWLGGTGNWSNSANWSGGTIPNSGGITPTSASLSVKIDNGNATASVVTLDQNATIADATLDAGDSLSINTGLTLTLAGPGVSVFNGALSFSGSGKLDLTTSEMLTQASLATIRSQIVLGKIVTSSAGGALGYLAVGGGQVEVRFTLLGDTDLDHKVDVTDLGNLASNYGATTGAIWSQGDFDYNNTVDVSDLGDLASAYGSSLGAPSPADGAPALPLTGGATVPEPASQLWIGLSAAALLGQRRRRRHRI